MDLKIYQKENTLRKDYSKVTDDHLTIWNPDVTPIEVDPKDPFIIAKNSSKQQGVPFIDKKDFNKKFHHLTGGMLSYIDWSGIVVAGGAVSNTINNNCTEKHVSDVDLFLYMAEPDVDKAKQKVEDIISAVTAYCEDIYKTDLHILKNKHVISLIPNKLDKRKHKVQIILRLYKCIYEVLAGFDIDSSAVAYNGRDILMTDRSINAFRTGYNVVDMNRRSPSYESRLYKYSKRGFGVYIPFKFEHLSNKMYFYNRHSLGLDKLLYLLRCKDKINQFMNIMTQRINRKLNYSRTSDYEDKELVFDEGDIRNTVVSYNKQVSEDSKYKLYNKYSKISKYLSFITHNPGQQLTGSFNPITEGDWINVDYLSRGVDFLGRRLELLSVKNGVPVDFVNTKDKKVGEDVYDNSFFNLMCYMIMYTQDEDVLIQAWDKQNLMPKNSNLYNISYVDLVTLMGRKNLLKYILEKEKDNNLNYTNIINICFFMDSVELLTIVDAKRKINIHNYTDTIKRFNCLNIANHFCLKINNYQKQETLEQMKSMDTVSRVQFLHNFWYKWGFYYQTVNLTNAYDKLEYWKLSVDELRMLNHLEQGNRAALRKICETDVTKKYSTKLEPPYDKESFEYIWYHYCLNKAVEKETNKDKQRSQFALLILKDLYSLTPEELDKIRNIEFQNPVLQVNPFIFYIMRCVYLRNFEDLKDIKPLYRFEKEDYKPLEELLIYLDDLDLLNQVLNHNQNEISGTDRTNSNRVEQFLKDKEIRPRLKPKLCTHIEKVEKERLNLQKDNIFTKYAKLFSNTDDHTNVFNFGTLRKDYERKENCFGLTPCDYVINKLLYFYNTIVNRYDALTEDQLKLLTNLRKSLDNVDRTKKIQPIGRDRCLDSGIEEVLDMLE